MLRSLRVATTSTLLLSRTLATTSSVSSSSSSTSPLQETALHSLHVELGGKMVEYAGWSMPVSYASAGVKESHLHVRAKAGLFDVSHMGQLRIEGPDRVEFMERLVPGNLAILKDGACRLTALTNEDGGIIDDTLIQRVDGDADGVDDALYCVVNAGCYSKDMAHFDAQLEVADDLDLSVCVSPMKHFSLLALQGPSAAPVLASLLSNPADADDLASFPFMTGRAMTLLDDSIPVHVTRCGYTGEDGFEISVPDQAAEDLARAILAHPDVLPIGLGARDSLRLEAGLCLYGNDMDESTSLIEAGLGWFLGKRRKEEANFLGAGTILEHLAQGAPRSRVGLVVDGAPVRNGAVLVDAESEKQVGLVTSGVPSPSLGKNIAMAYIDASTSSQTPLAVKGRKKLQPASIVPMPFVPPNYHRVPKKKPVE